MEGGSVQLQRLLYRKAIATVAGGRQMAPDISLATQDIGDGME